MAASPWWNVGQYAAPDGSDWGESTTWGRTLLEQSPQTAWYRYGRQQGVEDNGSNFSKWFAAQYPQFEKGYSAYVASNPVTSNIVDYLNSLGGLGAFQQQFNALDPHQRGLDPGGRGGGPARWIAR